MHCTNHKYPEMAEQVVGDAIDRKDEDSVRNTDGFAELCMTSFL